MGHMNQKRQNICSTSKEVKITSDLEDATFTPVGMGDKTYLVYAVVIDQGPLFTDLIGRFCSNIEQSKLACNGDILIWLQLCKAG
jgi:hypothetical protein